MVDIYISLSLLLVAAWGVRALQTKNYWFYLFMVWNMFLAAVPVLAIVMIDSNPTKVAEAVSVIIWLLFLPNAFYLLTDLMHLNQDVLVNKRDNKHTTSLTYKRGDPLFVVDSTLLFLTVLFGMIVGGIAVNEMFSYLSDYSVNLAKWGILFALLASALGVYIGRFGRWNSWDAVIKPHKVLLDFFKSLGNSKERSRVLIVTSTMFAFQLVSWAVILLYEL